MGSKLVAVRYNELKANPEKSDFILPSATKDSLKAAPGFKYDSDMTTWVPDNQSASNNKMKQ